MALRAARGFSWTRRGFPAGLSREQWDRADHSQHPGAGIPDLVELARHQQDGIAGADRMFIPASGFENAFPFEEINLVLLFMVME
jgi:hypothetical protein